MLNFNTPLITEEEGGIAPPNNNLKNMTNKYCKKKLLTYITLFDIIGSVKVGLTFL